MTMKQAGCYAVLCWIPCTSTQVRWSESGPKSKPVTKVGPVVEFLRMAPRRFALCAFLCYASLCLVWPVPTKADACDPMTTTACNNGSCYAHNGLEVCVCELPWTGANCDKTMSLCTKDCGVNSESGLDCQTALCGLGSCADSNVPPYYSCTCGDFYTGSNCEIQSNPCSSASSNPCANGACTFASGKNSGTVTCVCDDGWEVPQGATSTIIKWGNSEVLMGPPCSQQQHRGVANLALTLTSGEMIIWWIVFAISIIALVWCCYTVCAETCSKYIRTIGRVRAGAQAVGAI
ncbi:UNVERIFIED_CONTAM: hypothetical protein HHA_265040 [Hammondia hammondi]|eukprot:XP_008887221.1 hypothetical protein HHA_265040 [Hammondia hammondi]